MNELILSYLSVKIMTSYSLKMIFLTLVISSLLIFGCKSEKTITLFNNVRITIATNPTTTSFSITTPLGNGVDINDAWLGIGLNTVNRMVF